MDSGGSVLGIIPARINSSRFPRKVLANIGGKPMIYHVWNAVSQARQLQSLIVAVDDKMVENAVYGFGGESIMTPTDLASGTDRVAWVAGDRLSDIVVNIQGDEPLIQPQAIDHLVLTLKENPSIDMATLAVKKPFEPHNLNNPNIVKVVTNESGKAIYFSRKPLQCSKEGAFLKHIGIYAYRRMALFRFCNLPPSPLELTEKLEQLRAIENGFHIQVILIEKDTIAVDLPSDLIQVEKAMGLC